MHSSMFSATDVCVYVLLFQVSQYKISQIPRGICVIFNNVHFTTMKERSGSDKDQSLFFKYFCIVFRYLALDILVTFNLRCPCYTLHVVTIVLTIRYA